MGPKKTLFMDEISTGLDSSTTFQITRTLREFSHLRAATMLVALLQPTPETYELFDDIMLLSEGTVPCLTDAHRNYGPHLCESARCLVVVLLSISVLGTVSSHVAWGAKLHMCAT